MKKPCFRHLGEHPILDFCNTLVCHADSIEENLLGPDDDEMFVKEFFSLQQKFDLPKHKELIELRGILKKYFEFLIGLDKSNVDAVLNKWLANHAIILQINKDASTHFTSSKQQNHFAPFINSLNSFLINLDLIRLKKCANPNCSHFFYDISKNNKRQWCSMKSCGNIMKARAFYARKRLAK